MATKKVCVSKLVEAFNGPKKYWKSQPMTLVKILTALLIPIFASEAFGDSSAGAGASAASRPSTTGANHSTTPDTPTNKNNAAIEAIASVVNRCNPADVDCNGTPATYSPHSPQEETKNMLLVNEGMLNNQPLLQSSDQAAVDGYGPLDTVDKAVQDFRSKFQLAPTDSYGCEQNNFELGSKVTFNVRLNRGDCSSKPSSDAIQRHPIDPRDPRDPRTPSTTSSGGAR
jgi:hypothetical protein